MNENDVNPIEENSKPDAGLKEKHTPENTPMRHTPESTAIQRRPFVDKDKEQGFLSFFLGNTKESQGRVSQLLNLWLDKNGQADLYKQGKTSEALVNATASNWSTHLEEFYPGKTLDEMENIASELFRFTSELRDGIMVRSPMIHEEDVTNVSNRGSGKVTPDITGLTPSPNTSGFSIAEQMRRAPTRAKAGQHQFNVLLRDSYTCLTFVRPNKLELSALVTDIARTVRGVVRTVGNNIASVTYGAGMKVIWDFLAKRIVNCSIDGMTDYNQLSSVIRRSDFPNLCMALIRATHDDGINLSLHCLNTACDWNEFQVVDPEAMIRIRKSIETPEDAAIYGNLYNGNMKLTLEETLSLIDKADYALETNKVYGDDGMVYFEIKNPSIFDSIETFEYYSARINSDLADIRSKQTDPQEYERAVGLHLGTLGACEFIPWIGSMHVLGDEQKGIEPQSWVRSNLTNHDFNEGLMSVLLDNQDLNKNTTSFIFNKTPLMSKTFVGVANSECPKCKKRAEDNNKTAKSLGYTPLDPYMAFFTYTQLKMMTQAAETMSGTEEALS